MCLEGRILKVTLLSSWRLATPDVRLRPPPPPSPAGEPAERLLGGSEEGREGLQCRNLPGHDRGAVLSGQ